MLQMTPSRILLIGKQEAVREEIAGRLTAAGHKVVQAESLGRGDHHPADAVILYSEDAGQLASGCGAVRRHPSLKDLPLLAVVAERLLKELDLSAGMEEVLVYPFKPAELLLRVNLVLWRRDKSGSSQILKIGELTIDLANYVVRFRGETLELTLKEYELLSYLASNPGRVFTRAVLLNNVWGYEYFGGTRTVDVHIRRLRAKLGDWGEEMIETVRGVGYRFRGG
jgi:two-component system alkaline phosphatase synthesis response regulator PhoP